MLNHDEFNILGAVHVEGKNRLHKMLKIASGNHRKPSSSNDTWRKWSILNHSLQTLPISSLL